MSLFNAEVADNKTSEATVGSFECQQVVTELLLCKSQEWIQWEALSCSKMAS